MRTGELRILKPSTSEGREPLRFHWNSPLIMSRHKPGVLYLGGNHVFRFTDRAEHYAVISPDLSRNEPDKDTSGWERRGGLWSGLCIGGIPSASGNFLGRNR